jgi:hypothetical protein
MMSGVPLETYWAFKKLLNNKFYYKAASCWFFILINLRCTDPWVSNWTIYVLQLFRRVAAALPGMDSTENKPPEDSILFSCHVRGSGKVLDAHVDGQDLVAIAWTYVQRKVRLCCLHMLLRLINLVVHRTRSSPLLDPCWSVCWYSHMIELGKTSVVTL